MPDDCLDCLIVGGGPAGLTAALYFARFQRRVLVVDGGEPRADWIPVSHNIPMFPDGLSGRDLLARQRQHVARYGGKIVAGTVATLDRAPHGFVARMEGDTGREMRARHVLLATGVLDIEPDLPDLPAAVRRGLIRYCPICDGYEARGRRIAVIGHGTQGLNEAVFVARTYSDDVTLLTLGETMDPSADERDLIAKHGIKLVQTPIRALQVEGDRIGAFRTDDGQELRYEVLYSALGLTHRTALACKLGAEQGPGATLVVDEHNQTSVTNLYAAGAIVRGLDQIVVAMGHAAVAATAIHNKCERPTQAEP